MNQAYKKLMEKQQYLFIGEHSAVKICGWTKKALQDEGMCYKGVFYGINSHRCIQMSPAINFCDMDCVYCWRDRNNSSFGKIDKPKEIMEAAIRAQRKLLTGYKGNPKTNQELMKESKEPMHVAISLNGEATYYPHLSELIRDIKRRGWSSYLVTNGMLPQVLENLELPTQLYISLDAANEELQNKITRSMHKDSWQRLMKSLDIMKSLKGKTRTTLRLTVVKGLNDREPEKYAELFMRANPDFIEVKAYMFVGASRERLEIQNMPYHEEVKAFAEKIAQFCPYKISAEQEASRVVLMTKEDSAPRFIDFEKLKQEYIAQFAQEAEIPANPELDTLVTAYSEQDQKDISQEEKFIPISAVKVKV
jgi:tRNA wybutosine-synthesizing protein 1